jgi:hypothetical protein
MTLPIGLVQLNEPGCRGHTLLYMPINKEVLLSYALRYTIRKVLQLRHHVTSTRVELVLLTGADKGSVSFPPHRTLQITHASSDLCNLAEMLAGGSNSRRWQTHLHF